MRYYLRMCTQDQNELTLITEKEKRNDMKLSGKMVSLHLSTVYLQLLASLQCFAIYVHI